MMLERDSFSSTGDCEPSTVLQLFLDCIHRTVESITEFVSVRERVMHFEITKTLSLRDVDSTADDGAWAIINNGWKSCSHSEV